MINDLLTKQVYTLLEEESDANGTHDVENGIIPLYNKLDIYYQMKFHQEFSKILKPFVDWEEDLLTDKHVQIALDNKENWIVDLNDAMLLSFLYKENNIKIGKVTSKDLQYLDYLLTNAPTNHYHKDIFLLRSKFLAKLLNDTIAYDKWRTKIVVLLSGIISSIGALIGIMTKIMLD